jgi:Zn-dependent peptidase ImmA (M78 family)
MPTDHDQEREANAFAAELMMPESAIRSLMVTDPIDVFDDAAVKQLANRFGVSTQALIIRLTELDLVLPR